MQELTTPQGDYGHYLFLTFTDNDGVAVDITDYTMIMKLWRPATPGTLVLEEECEIISGPAGTLKYLVQEGDFDDALTYAGEIEKTGESVCESSMPIRLIVTESG